MYSVHFTQAARAEVIEAQDWYENEGIGLGRRFREAIDEDVPKGVLFRTIAEAAKNPLTALVLSICRCPAPYATNGTR